MRSRDGEKVDQRHLSSNLEVKLATFILGVAPVWWSVAVGLAILLQ